MTPELTCATCRDLLPDYVAGALDTPTIASMARHLATCTGCQAELAAWHEIDAALHRRDARLPGDAAAGAGWRALHAQLAPANRMLPVSAPTSHHEMSISAMNDRHITPMPTPPAPAPRRAPWVAAIATAMVAVLGIATFAIFAHQGPGKGIAILAQPTATSTPVPANIPIDPKTGLPTTGQIIDIQMDGPSDGWAVGNINADKDGNTTAYTEHYTDGRWQAIGPSYPHAYLNSLSIATQGDVWAVGTRYIEQTTSDGHGGSSRYPLVTGSLVIRFTDGAWHEVQIPGVYPTHITMFASGDGWVYGSSDKAGNNFVLARYHKGTWTTVTTPTAFTTYPVFDMFAPNEGWVGNNHDLWHYLNGQWTKAAISTPGFFDGLSMSGPSDGWAGGFIPTASGGALTSPSNIRFTAPASSIGDATPFLLHYDGTAWHTVPVPSIINAHHGWISSITMASATVGWMQAEETNGTQFLLHYDGQTWLPTPVPGTAQFIIAISSVSPSEAWACGAKVDTTVKTFTNGAPFVPVLLHYTDGAWQVYTQP
jgi:hypothetical protein